MGSTDQDEIRAEVLRVASAVLGRSPDAKGFDRASEGAWDSLKHVELLFALEDELGVRFDEEELAGLSSTDALVDSIARHRGAP